MKCYRCKTELTKETVRIIEGKNTCSIVCKVCGALLAKFVVDKEDEQNGSKVRVFTKSANRVADGER